MGRQYGISGDAGRSQCQRYAAIGHFIPAAVLSVSAKVAFLTQYMISFVLAFLGMYLLVKESTESSILAVIAGACFCVLPLYPVYGLSEFGIPWWHMPFCVCGNGKESFPH